VSRYSWQFQPSPVGSARQLGLLTRSDRGDRRADADAFKAAVEHKKLVGECVDASAGRQTFESFAEAWRTSQVQHRPTTATIFKAAVEDRVIAYGRRARRSISRRHEG
jgi:hypothetical protein